MKEIGLCAPIGGFYTVKVLTLDDFPGTLDFKVGDFVDEEVINYLRNNLPPVTDWAFLFQSGGAVCDRITEDGTLHPAYDTFITGNGLPYWEYRGACLMGEQRERGEIPVWQRKS